MTTRKTDANRHTQERRCSDSACLIQTLRKKGIPSGLILDAFLNIPRDRFVPDDEKPYAWEDRPLPIGAGQTISQPYTVAYMLQLAGVNPGDKVLEIGTGSGYAAALLVYIVGSQDLVTTVELNPELYMYGGKRLAEIGMSKVHRILGNCRDINLPGAPFDVIIVSAQAPLVPQALINALGMGGRLVMPVETGTYSVMTRLLRTQDGIETTRHEAFQFVPLL